MRCNGRPGQGNVYSRREEFVHFAFQPESDGRLVIMVGRSAIDDDVWRAMLRGNEGKGRGRIHRQSGAQRDYQIRFRRRLSRALKFSRVETLTEADGGGFEESSTLTQRRATIDAEEFEMRFGISPPVTALTFDQRIRAVEFDEAFRAGAGKTMQSVDVLCNDGAKFPRALQTHDRVMNGVWFRVAKSIPRFKFVFPVLDSGVFRSHEILKVNRLSSGPDALRSAEIRDAAASRDSGAGEDQRLLGRTEVFGEGH